MTGELYGLFGSRTMGVLPLVWLLLLLALVSFLLRRYFSREKKVVLVDEDEEEPFDLELRHGALTHLRNHCEEYDQGVFMNELYRLLIDSMGAKYNAETVLEAATKEQLTAFTFLQQEEKELLQTLYTPIFEAGAWSEDHKHTIIDRVEHLVLGRDDLATHELS